MGQIDLVCGMEVVNENYTLNYKKKNYYFCSKGCMDDFRYRPKSFLQKNKFDLVIIGGGPAGLTAAVYASVQKIKTFLITKNIGGQAIESSSIKNYLGFDFITGKELVDKFKSQFLHKHYLKHKIDEVSEISKKGKVFKILTVENELIETNAVIVASGMKSRKLGIPGEKIFLRKGVSYSSVQDIDLFRDLDVVVVGGGNSGIQTANDLKSIAKKVTLISDLELSGDTDDILSIRNNSKVQILEYYDIIEILGKENVEGVIAQSKSDSKTKKIPCKGVFIQIGFMPNTEFCKNLINLNDKCEIKIKNDCSTNIEGLFACGDVTDISEKRIIIAAGDGAKAALNARKYLRNF